MLASAWVLLANHIYVPLHLSTEVHLGDIDSPVASGSTLSSVEDGVGDRHPSHEAHPASDHPVQLTSRQSPPSWQKCFASQLRLPVVVQVEPPQPETELPTALLVPRPIPPPLPPNVRAPPSSC